MDDDVAGLVASNLLSPLPGFFLGRDAADGVARVALAANGPAVGAFHYVLMLGHDQ